MRGIVLGSAMLMVPAMVAGEAPAADGWVALFDGRTLDERVHTEGPSMRGDLVSEDDVEWPE